MDKLTNDEIERLSYTDFVALIGEENRPSGGKRSVHEIMVNSMLSSRSKVLEVGCTNGFTSLEIARTLRCSVLGIDVHELSVSNAQKRSEEDRARGIDINFKVASAYDLPFEDNAFDLVITGNATSFMEEKSRAISEYKRVVRPWGLIALTPIWYREDPPASIIDEVSSTIGVNITPYNKRDWLTQIEDAGLELYYENDHFFRSVTDSDIEQYVSSIMEKPSLVSLSPVMRDAVASRWERTMRTFRNNLDYTGFSVLLARKRLESEENELFITC